MTVESNYVIAIAKLRFKRLASFPTNVNQNQNQSHHVRVIFPALRASPVVIGRSNCFGFGFSTVI